MYVRPCPRIKVVVPVFAVKGVSIRQTVDPFSPRGVLSMFRQLYKDKYKVEYTSSTSLKYDLRELELLADKLSDPVLLYYCIQVYFSKDMAWVKNKRLDFFFDLLRVQRYVLPLAIEAMDKVRKRPEWSSDVVAHTTSVFIPKGIR